MNFLCFNGEILPTDKALFNAQNRGFRYGDGVFETMKIFKGKILLEPYHFDRLFSGLKMLKINGSNLSLGKLGEKVLELCSLNNCADLAKVRLAVYREENIASYVIETSGLNQSINELNEKGWVIDIYPHVRKSQDAFANLKTANYLPYVLADIYAKENSLNECLVLNSENNICDASKANIFLLLKEEIYTPALHQGCVSGTMRRFIIEELKSNNIPVHQQNISEKTLLEAEEVFLTNAINGVRWVENFREKSYSNTFIKNGYQQMFSKLYI
jgi:branched-chain amino acid aminotransferase